VRACVRVRQHTPVVEARLGVWQLGLPVVELVGEMAAQIQIAVDHAVDSTQHQLGRAGGQVGARRTLTLRRNGQQTRRVEIELISARRVDREHHPFKHRKAHRAGVNMSQRRRAAAPGAGCGCCGWRAYWHWRCICHALAGCQAPDYQNVVGRGAAEMRGQLRGEQAGDVQVDQAAAGQQMQAWTGWPLAPAQTRLARRRSGQNRALAACWAARWARAPRPALG
jgi:hypothetical protein